MILQLSIRAKMFSIIIFVLCISTIDGQYREAYITLGNGVTSERNLPVCSSPNQACNIVYRRFWLSPKVVRLCKCADRSECPWNWISEDKHTVNVSGRVQIKFCSTVGDLSACGPNEAGLATRMVKNLETGLVQRQAYIGCYCDMSKNYFKEFRTELGEAPGLSIREQYYSCYEMKTCQKGAFCGHITYGRYETYNTCQCPYYTVCIWKERKTVRISLPLYEGPVYRGYCQTY